MRRHPFDAVSAIAGLITIAFGLAFGLTDFHGFSFDIRWVVPLALMGAGLLGMAGVWRSHRR